MDFISYLGIGNLFSEFFSTLAFVFSQDVDTVYQFLFNGLALNVPSGILDEYLQIITYELRVPDIPILSDLLGGMFTLLFVDGNFAHLPFYYSFIICLARVIILVVVVDVIAKIFGIVKKVNPL